ncbi:MAG: hypothetical protein COA50_04030 [Flavobacteriaceae bacterium]|nr:MAG: hypothetical protein COA50_04030 [Flavobacteriaceae bacterium]
MIMPSFKEITDKALNAFKRFPITLIWAIFGTLFFIWLIDVDSTQLFDKHQGTMLTFGLGVSWLIGTKFLMEHLNQPKKWQWLQIVTLLLLIAFYLHLPDLKPNNVNPKYYIRFILYLLAGHLFLFFAPFAFKWNKEAYWNYLKSICIAVGRSFLFSGVLYLGLVLALLAVKYLFDFEIRGERYGQLFVFCLGIVNTWTYLSDFPKNILDKNTIKYNKALEVFVKYILIPLVLLYIVILYAYTIKIVLAWNLPKGWVSYLVTALALLGFAIQIMINPVQKTIKSWTINRFYPWFYILLLPLIILLFVAIFKRIGDYGITENRYFILVIAIWILGITLYLLISKRKSLKMLPSSLFLLIVLGSFGFWSVFNISKNSQKAQFINLFSAVKENNNIATGTEHDQLKSIIDYLNDRKAVSELDEITGISIENAMNDTVLSWSNYSLPRKLLDSLQISIDQESLIAEKADSDYYYYNNWDNSTTLNISGFKYFKQIHLSNNNDNMEESLASFNIQFLHKSNELWLVSKKDSTLKLGFSLQDRLMTLSTYGPDPNELEADKLTMVSKHKSLSGKLIFNELNFTKEKDSIHINNANAYLFLKVD